jgi:fructose-specific phosphotransferase system IIA component
MRITDILSKEQILLNITFTSKEEAIRTLVSEAQKSGYILDSTVVLSAIMEREKIMSTGIGHGFALPHCKTSGIEKTIGVVAVLQSPLEFDSLDNNPVNVIFLLLSTENSVGNHLKLLSRISKIMNSSLFRTKLIASKNQQDAFTLFLEEENETMPI